MSNMLNKALDFMGFLTMEEDDDEDVINIKTMSRDNHKNYFTAH